MLSEFNFKGFNPEDSLKISANEALERLLKLAPANAIAVALLEREGRYFRCAVDIYTQSGPFISSGSGVSADEAIAHVEKALSKKLTRWQEGRHIDPGTPKLDRSFYSVA